MIRRFIPVILILCPIASYGQFGVNFKYLFGQSETLDSLNISQDGLHISLEYSFRPKQKRIEFHPGLGYRTTAISNLYEGDIKAFDLDFNTAIYPFDFEGDCDCPTWSKEGTLFKKGFFIEVSPGLTYQTLTRHFWTDFVDHEPIKSSKLLLKLGASVGLDIGISEQLTLTPMLSWTRIATEEWDNLQRDNPFFEKSVTLDDQTYLGAGLRLAYKPDPKRRRRF